MIDAKELRIGNLILIDGLVLEVDGIDFYEKILVEDSTCDDGFSSNCSDDVEPIPLTEEWLVKFGFEYRTRLNPNPKELAYIHQKGGFYIAYMKIFYWEGGNTTIDYVHQLQNLYFALTNEELKIK